MKAGILLLILFVFLFLEGSVTFVPLVFDAILVLYVLKREAWIFTLAFFAGLMLDVVYVRQFGQTSLFFLASLFLVFLYERKYEIKTKEFVFLFSFLAGGAYLYYFNRTILVTQTLLNSLAVLVLFLALSWKRNQIF